MNVRNKKNLIIYNFLVFFHACDSFVSLFLHPALLSACLPVPSFPLILSRVSSPIQHALTCRIVCLSNVCSRPKFTSLCWSFTEAIFWTLAPVQSGSSLVLFPPRCICISCGKDCTVKPECIQFDVKQKPKLSKNNQLATNYLHHKLFMFQVILNFL